MSENNHPNRDALRASHRRLYAVAEFLLVNAETMFRPDSLGQARNMLRVALEQARRVLD